jgi:hypothetical protein
LLVFDFQITQPIKIEEGPMLKPFAWLALLSAISVAAQDTPKSIALTNKSNVAAKEILKSLRKDCPNVSITTDSR